MRRRSQTQPPCRGQGDVANLRQHEGEARRAQAFLDGPQRLSRAAALDDDEAPRIEAGGSEAGAIERPDVETGLRGEAAQHRSARRARRQGGKAAHGEADGEGEGGGAIACRSTPGHRDGRADLVHAAAAEPGTEATIDPRLAERPGRRRRGRSLQGCVCHAFERANAGAQGVEV